ncbi:MAG: sterol desaturase family protein [Henriciella sp.]|nr:sterol desaturase family protein [Henriciella sp.]
MPVEPFNLFGLSEPALRFAAFAIALTLFASLEALAPRRRRNQARLARWTTNTSMLIVATVLVRGLSLALPVFAAVEATQIAGARQFGVFHQFVLPLWIEILTAVILLDLAIWFQHLLSHKIPLLWRLHRVHHADRDFDTTTALRFHPFEIALSAVYKFFVVMLLGPALLAVILFEIALNATSLFNHANLNLPRWLDQTLRTLFVTPDMHRVHHSIERDEHDTNYGFCLSVWDRLFRTYTAQPKAGHQGMTIGLADTQSAPTQALGWSLIYPFHRK